MLARGGAPAGGVAPGLDRYLGICYQFPPPPRLSLSNDAELLTNFLSPTRFSLYHNTVRPGAARVPGPAATHNVGRAE